MDGSRIYYEEVKEKDKYHTLSLIRELKIYTNELYLQKQSRRKGRLVWVVKGWGGEVGWIGSLGLVDVELLAYRMMDNKACYTAQGTIFKHWDKPYGKESLLHSRNETQHCKSTIIQ